jgi:hypothetical protein
VQLVDSNSGMFLEQNKFHASQTILQNRDTYSDVIDLFIFKNAKLAYGQGQYSMYVVSTNGVLLYEGVDKVDKSSIVIQPISTDFMNCVLTQGAVDCTSDGRIIFDLKAINNQHTIKCFTKMNPEELYDYKLEGEKKMIRFFGNYVIEVKTEKGLDRI